MPSKNTPRTRKPFVYTETLRVESGQVNAARRLRVSALMRLLQQASVAHTQLLGCGRERTLDKGLLWVVVRQDIRIRRMPEYDETVVLKTWPLDTMHVLFPRGYQITSETGETLVCGCMLWTLVDARTRKAVFPEPYGIAVAGVQGPAETPLPEAVAERPLAREQSYTGRFSQTDINGHINNACYFDLCEDLIPVSTLLKKSPCRVQAQYTHEIRMGEKIIIRCGGRRGSWQFADGGRRSCFRIELDYK